MDITTSLALPAFAISDDTAFINQQVVFNLIFNRPHIKDSVTSYRSYLDEELIINQKTDGTTGTVTCGIYIIARCILSAAGWSGFKSMPFQTCPLSVIILGSDTIEEQYSLKVVFPEACMIDISDSDTWSVFEGNITQKYLLHILDMSQAQLQVTSKPGSQQITKNVTVKPKYNSQLFLKKGLTTIQSTICGVSGLWF